MIISVIMTCFNEGPYIAAAVQSILDQSRQDLVGEILIADDGSEPATLEVLAELPAKDPRISVSYGAGNGLAKNRNRIAAEASGQYIAILDGDDLWTPDKLERQFELHADAAVGLSYTGYAPFSGADPSTARPARLHPLPAQVDRALAYLLNDPPIMPSSIIVRADVYRQLAGFDESIRVFEDTDFYLRAARICRFACVDKPLLLKRNHAGSMTAKLPQMMMHHAFVAFRFAAEYPPALPLVPKRLSQRALKLGNVSYYGGDLAAAARYYLLARRLNAANLMAWALWLLAAVGGRAAYALLRRWTAPRAAALGR
jgi:glycosyltransferase involved in cell wall biosynthesis